MLNKSIICGTLLAAPVTFKGFAKFNLMVIDTYFDREGVEKTVTTPHPITMSGRAAESFIEHAMAGDVILVEGKLVSYRFTDPKGKEMTDYRTFAHSYKILLAMEDKVKAVSDGAMFGK